MGSASSSSSSRSESYPSRPPDRKVGFVAKSTDKVVGLLGSRNIGRIVGAMGPKMTSKVVKALGEAAWGNAGKGG